jgi:hypothetical protein
MTSTVTFLFPNFSVASVHRSNRFSRSCEIFEFALLLLLPAALPPVQPVLEAGGRHLISGVQRDERLVE